MAKRPASFTGHGDMPLDGGGAADALEEAPVFDERLFFPTQAAKSAPTAAKSAPANAEADYHGHRERLRNRYRDGGDAALADYEILELLLFTEGINCLTLGTGVPAQEIAAAAAAYHASLVVLLFDRGISGKIAGQEIRSLRRSLAEAVPLIVSGRAVNLLAKPIDNVQIAADFNSVMSSLRARGVLPAAPVTRVPDLPDTSQTA